MIAQNKHDVAFGAELRRLQLTVPRSIADGVVDHRVDKTTFETYGHSLESRSVERRLRNEAYPVVLIEGRLDFTLKILLRVIRGKIAAEESGIAAAAVYADTLGMMPVARDDYLITIRVRLFDDIVYLHNEGTGAVDDEKPLIPALRIYGRFYSVRSYNDSIARPALVERIYGDDALFGELRYDLAVVYQLAQGIDSPPLPRGFGGHIDRSSHAETEAHVFCCQQPHFSSN